MREKMDSVFDHNRVLIKTVKKFSKHKGKELL